MSDINKVRLERIQIILKENAIDTEAFAFCIGMDPDKLVKLFSSNNPKITDAQARLIEQTFSKAKHWLDGNVKTDSNFDLFG